MLPVGASDYRRHLYISNHDDEDGNGRGEIEEERENGRSRRLGHVAAPR